MAMDYCDSDSCSSVLSTGSVGLGRATRFAAHEGPQYSLVACYAFTINYILGVGSLGMPYAAREAGYVAGFILIVLVSLLSFVTVMMVARAALRAELLTLHPCEKNEVGKWCYVRCIATIGEIKMDGEEAMCSACAENCRLPPKGFEVVQLCDQFLGKAGRLSYQVALVVLMYCGLLAYVLVFIATLTSLFALPRPDAVLICGVIMIPVSMLNLSEMVPLQVTLSVVNIVSLLVMGGISMGTVIADPAKMAQDTKAVNFDGLGLAFSTALFSQLFQHSVPGLINPLKRSDRQRVPRTFGMALCTTAVLYVFLSAGCVLAFGAAMEQSVNVNFAKFDWGPNPPALGKALSWFCAFYPALATIAVFPLITITLGSSLLVVAPFSSAFRFAHHRKLTVFFRLLAAFPPVIISLTDLSLSTAFKFAGLGGIWVAFVTPALLQLYSKRAMQERFAHLIAVSPRRQLVRRAYSARDLLRDGVWIPPSASEHEVTSAHKLTPIFPTFNEKTWIKIVLLAAVLAAGVVIWGIVMDFIALGKPKASSPTQLMESFDGFVHTVMDTITH